MTRELLETAKKEGLPFTVNMADGRQYRVDTADQIHIAKTHIVIVDKNIIPHILPLLTITGLTYNRAGKAKQR